MAGCPRIIFLLDWKVSNALNKNNTTNMRQMDLTRETNESENFLKKILKSQTQVRNLLLPQHQMLIFTWLNYVQLKSCHSHLFCKISLAFRIATLRHHRSLFLRPGIQRRRTYECHVDAETPARFQWTRLWLPRTYELLNTSGRWRFHVIPRSIVDLIVLK